MAINAQPAVEGYKPNLYLNNLIESGKLIMVSQPFVPPRWDSSSFNCPFCNVYAHQTWGKAQVTCKRTGRIVQIPNVSAAHCSHCEGFSIWVNDRLIRPDVSNAPPPNPDLPDEIKADFEEARSIISRSPRGAAALLRLCIQKLCSHLGESGKNINDDIASLVEKGLRPEIQKSLDIVRVIGNEAVHPGTIDLQDDVDTATQLCHLINIIADAMITQPKMIKELYQKLPEEKRKHIEQRDKTNT